MITSSLVASTLLGLACSQQSFAAEKETKKPNVIFIFADQMRNASMGF